MTPKMSPARSGRAKRVWRVALVSAVALIPLSLVAQTSGQRGTASRPAAPPSADDAVLQAESYQTPPKELADAVLAPRYLNVTLGNPSPDKKWFLDDDRRRRRADEHCSPSRSMSSAACSSTSRANRARAMTIRNNTGIQIISAADGSRKKIQVPAGLRVANATWSPDGKCDRVLRPVRRRDAHLARRRRDRRVASADEDARARDARDELRLHRRRQADRDRAGSRRPRADAARRSRPLPAGPEVKVSLGGRSSAAHVPEPDAHPAATSRCSSGTRPARSRSSTSRRAR